MKTFATVFPHITIFWGIPGEDLIVLGSEEPIQIDVGRLAASLAIPEVAADLERIHIRGAEDLLAHYLMDDQGARAFVGDAPLNTGDNALIEFRAPLTMHAWADTLKTNAQLFRALAVDPLTRASGVSEDPLRQAASYTMLGQAFYGKRMHGRAVAAVRRAQELYPTNAGAQRLATYEAAAQEADRK